MRSYERPMAGIGRRTACGLVVLACLPLAAAGQGEDGASYFEFGTVVALGRKNVDIQTFDQTRQKTVQRSFDLTKDTRADLVHVGDAVEVIYGQTAAGLPVRRLLLLSGGVPVAGPPGVARRDAAPATDNSALPAVPAVATVTHAPAPRAGAARKVPTPAAAKLPTGSAGSAKTTTAVADPGVSAGTSLAGRPAPKPAAASLVPLGVSQATGARPAVPVAKNLTRDTPGEECHRDDPAWPSAPLSIAVLDFRYPTAREEAHDIGSTGGGSGTAVADLVFNRLGQQPEFHVARGDRRRLDRSDIAGAARMGRELGVDAVLEGTFFPIEQPAPADGGFAPPPDYVLHAGLVDTCTGQVLMKLSSDSCEAVGGTQSNAPGCARYVITAKQAADPQSFAAQLNTPIETLLQPLEHNQTPPGQPGAIGTVTGSGAKTIVVRLSSGSGARAGDELAVHASRLTKNPSTYTLNYLRDQEIGRVLIGNVQGATATGTYAGDVPAINGDAIEKVAGP